MTLRIPILPRDISASLAARSQTSPYDDVGLATRLLNSRDVPSSVLLQTAAMENALASRRPPPVVAASGVAAGNASLDDDTEAVQEDDSSDDDADEDSQVPAQRRALDMLDPDQPDPLTATQDEAPVELASIGDSISDFLYEQAQKKAAKRKAHRQKAQEDPPAYLTKSQASALDRELLAAQNRGASADERRGIIDDFKAIARFQAAVQPLAHTDAFTRDYRETNINYDVKLAAQGQDARDAERHFSEKARATRLPWFVDVAGKFGEVGGAGGSNAASLAVSGLGSMASILVGHVLGSPEESRPPGKSILPEHNDPQPLAHIEVDGVKYPLYTRADVQKLSPGTGYIFTFEGADQRKSAKPMNAPQAYEAATSGAMSDPVTGRRIVPAVRYTNDVTWGHNIKRFDGFEASHVMTLIDAKYNFDSMKEGRKSNMDMQRTQKVLADNPQLVPQFELPTQKLADRFIDKARNELKMQLDSNARARK